MFTCYEESVMAHADADGKLSSSVIKQLFDEHGSDLNEFISQATDDNFDDAESILDWLGY